MASFFLFSLLGCATAPVGLVDYEDQPIRRSMSHGVSMDEVQIDVRMAATKAGWNVAAGETTGKMIAAKYDGKTSATVEITFNLDSYSIKYVDSTEMSRLDGCSSKTPAGSVKVEKRCISPTYNEWVSELNHEISSKMQY